MGTFLGNVSARDVHNGVDLPRGLLSMSHKYAVSGMPFGSNNNWRSPFFLQTSSSVAAEGYCECFPCRSVDREKGGNNLGSMEFNLIWKF